MVRFPQATVLGNTSNAQFPGEMERNQYLPSTMGWASCAREETPSLENPLAFVLDIDDSDSYLFLFSLPFLECSFGPISFFRKNCLFLFVC